MKSNIKKYSKTALIVIDPYNDFLSFPGKSWLLNRATISKNNSIKNMANLLSYCRSKMIPIIYAPHANYTKTEYSQRRFLNPSIFLAILFKAFKKDSWGGSFRREFAPKEGDIIASQHLTSSGFVNTDLDAILKEKGIESLVLCGCLSNTCVESTARSAVELGFEVTVIKDALVAMSTKDHAAAIDSGLPMICHRITDIEGFIKG